MLTIRCAPLSERSEDIEPLAHHFCELACERHGLPTLQVSPTAVHALEAARWPGNVRQLAHCVEAGCIRAASTKNGTVEAHHLFPDREPDTGDSLSFQESTRRFQRNLLLRTLQDANWNVAEAARRLDMTRSHLYKLIQANELRRKP